MIKVIMVGPSASSRGGISASISLLQKYLVGKGILVSRIETFDGDKSKLKKTISFFVAVLSLLPKLLFGNYDLVHVHMASNGSFFRKAIVCIFCLLSRTPYIIHLHGGGFRDFYRSRSDVGKFFVRFIFDGGAVVIVLSQMWGSWVRKTLGVNTVEVIFNGVEKTPGAPFPGVYNCSSISFFGLLGENKGTDFLIKVFRDIQIVMPNTSLELCGNGDLDFYKKLASGIPNIHFHGWVSAEVRYEVLKRSCVFCLPSWREGLPFSVLEAMSAGIPVVSTKVGSIPEAVVDGETGFLVEPGDETGLKSALIKLLGDRDLAVEMGLKGKERQERLFSLDSMGDKCLAVYMNLVSKKSNSGIS